ncbi:hypothetical protein [Desulforamulus aeronauticus]|uniref:Uncharacterized protein n=1 Tax=Desulforamulus aeronauticus DSM 10349 TaxID=1121421 RepID=A0A1M6SRE2_9FIRM|nr:hypothetical protein [Desulforamulus aeronauticus]SHK47197.1 hypothetical protein SAMN02745123_01974 [Desulforamulus aeronauticus DSM 10349]
MLAVSFFFVVSGVSLLLIGILGLFLKQLQAVKTDRKKWLLLSGGGFMSLLLGMLIAMT